MSREFEKATRRQMMRAGLAAVGGIVAVSSSASAEDKIAQAQVQYQETPKDGNKCSTCVNFQPPNACKIVAGTINPNGWCIAFAPKQQSNG
ncbi:high-potential iron-sulfur protein [Rhodopila sp.]|uniref:high-potential iron-sulfur protein n=1 Tax=Rhodopila sp. TaxID=2480087 RepID=UPI003D111D9F